MTNEKFEVILLIAGNSTRSKLSYNKNFYLINNKPIFRYSLEKFLGIKECQKVIIVYRNSDEALLEQSLNHIDRKRIDVVVGGRTRQESVYNGLLKADSMNILIHDGARPLINREEIMAVYEQVKRGNPCCLGYRVSDTIKKMTEKEFLTLDRDDLFAIQTPQGMSRDLLKEAILKANSENYIGYDDLSLLEKYYNIRPTIIPGNPYNVKATTLEDIKFISLILGDKNEL
ncbi:MAG: IspD/TarI family cytidylyltransferase [Bacilli bacterium]|nr:IspD/TarI family cytidylyltransferase [Bacilli bacterium]